MENEYVSNYGEERIYLKTTGVYILSILGLLCCCFGGLGIIFSGIALYIAHDKLKDVELNPHMYENIKGMKDAKTIALIITIICGINLLYSIYYAATADWDVMVQQTQEILEQSGYEY